DLYAITPGWGRPKRLDAHDRRIACRMIRSGVAQTAADVRHNQFPDVPARTACQALRQEGLNGCRKRKVPLMTKTH
ncbi:hypothetical protein B0H16DRAFT_1236531, partial [Mycena metata]